MRKSVVFVGHAALAFGLAALLADRMGVGQGDSEHRVRIASQSVSAAVAIGLVAALASILPDLDVVQSLVVFATDPGEGSVIAQLRAASRATHRLTTHSLVLAVPIAAGIGLWARRRWLSSALFVSVVGIVGLSSGPVAAAVAGVVVLGAAGIGALAGRWGLDARWTAVAVVLGLAIHPFTDLLTGTPPAMAAPLDVTVFSARIAPFADPFANLLLATGAELAAIWIGLVVAARLFDRSLREFVYPIALAGVASAPVALALEGPSVDHAAPFVATLLAVGGLVALIALVADRARSGVAALCTGLAAISVATVAAALAVLVL